MNNRRFRSLKMLVAGAVAEQKLFGSSLPTTMEETCTTAHNHEYADKLCVCGHIYCYSCCSSTNVDQSGKYEPDFMICPVCHRDFYSSYVRVTWEVTPYDWSNGPGHAETSVETEICLKEIAPHVGYERGFDRGQTHRIVTAVETL